MFLNFFIQTFVLLNFLFVSFLFYFFIMTFPLQTYEYKLISTARHFDSTELPCCPVGVYDVAAEPLLHVKVAHISTQAAALLAGREEEVFLLQIVDVSPEEGLPVFERCVLDPLDV